jgi:hypothetical protein
MELLLYGIPHRVVHDLESLLYVLLFICTHLQGPRNTVGTPPLYGGRPGCEHPSRMKDWIRTTDPVNLGHLKYSHMIGHFELDILPYISPYFQPLKQHISALWNTLFPHRFTVPTVGKEATHSPATCLDIIKVFKAALEDKSLIEEANQSSTILGKRSSPGDLVSAADSWDAVKVPKKLLTAEPRIMPTVLRKTKLMGKGHRVIPS